jgi:hypothetical protein
MLPLQWQNQSMRADKMSKGEELFWRLERYAHRWPPPWLPCMRNESNPVVFLDIAIRALDRSSLFLCLPYHRFALYPLYPLTRPVLCASLSPLYVYILHRHMHAFIPIHTYIHTYIRICMYACMYVCMYVCMHAI